MYRYFFFMYGRFWKFYLVAAPEVSEIQLAETQNDSGEANSLSFFCSPVHLKCSWLQKSYIPAIYVLQRSSAWQYGHHIFIRTSLPSGGSARGVSWALWPPRPHPPLGPILKAFFQPPANASCPGVNWKREALKCGSVSITLPWSNLSPVRPEVRKRERRGIKCNYSYQNMSV